MRSFYSIIVYVSLFVYIDFCGTEVNIMQDRYDAQRIVSMRNTMIIVYIILTAAAVAVLSVFLIMTKNNALMAQSQNYGAVAAEQSASTIENFCRNIEQASSIVYENKDFASFYPKGEEYTPEESEIRERISEILINTSYVSDYCDFGIIYSNNSHSGIISDGTRDLLGENYFSAAGDLLAGSEHKWNVFYSGNVSRVCYLKRINENAFFIASVYSTRLGHIFGNLMHSSNLFLYVADEKDRIIYSTDNSASFSGDQMPYESIEKLGGKTDISVSDKNGVCAAISMFNGWKVYSVVIPSNIGKFGNVQVETFLVIFGISLLIIFINAGFIISSFYASKRHAPRIVEDKIDPVTGVLSPYYCEERISDLMELSLVGGTWAFALVKINDYELIEERLGSEFTNEALKKTSDIITGFFGDKATAGLDIEHDFVLFCDFSDFDIFKAHNDLKARFSELRGMLDQVTVGENDDYKLDISIGVCIYPDHGSTFDELEFKARQALYSAMDTDGESLCYYDDKKSGGGKS